MASWVTWGGIAKKLGFLQILNYNKSANLLERKMLRSNSVIFQIDLICRSLSICVGVKYWTVYLNIK